MATAIATSVYTTRYTRLENRAYDSCFYQNGNCSYFDEVLLLTSFRAVYPESKRVDISVDSFACKNGDSSTLLCSARNDEQSDVVEPERFLDYSPLRSE